MQTNANLYKIVTHLQSQNHNWHKSTLACSSHRSTLLASKQCHNRSPPIQPRASPMSTWGHALKNGIKAGQEIREPHASMMDRHLLQVIVTPWFLFSWPVASQIYLVFTKFKAPPSECHGGGMQGAIWRDRACWHRSFPLAWPKSFR